MPTPINFDTAIELLGTIYRRHPTRVYDHRGYLLCFSGVDDFYTLSGTVFSIGDKNPLWHIACRLAIAATFGTHEEVFGPADALHLFLKQELANNGVVDKNLAYPELPFIIGLAKALVEYDKIKPGAIHTSIQTSPVEGEDLAHRRALRDDIAKQKPTTSKYKF